LDEKAKLKGDVKKEECRADEFLGESWRFAEQKLIKYANKRVWGEVQWGKLKREKCLLKGLMRIAYEIGQV
jgi:hypothetical protein